MTLNFFNTILVCNWTLYFWLISGVKYLNKLKLKEQSDKLLKIHRDITEFYNNYAKSMGLTLAALEVCHIIFDEKNCTQSVIVKKAYLPKQTVNAIIKKFCECGITELFIDDKIDKRNKSIKFTEKGKKYAEQIINGLKEIEYKALTAVGEEKTEELISIITVYKNNLKLI